MQSVLTYCEKCGHIGFSFLWDSEKNGCFSCNTKGSTKFVPQEYLDCTGNTIEENLEEEFIEKFIKSSPNFDQECWDRRIGYQETRKHQDEVLKSEMEELKHVPKCTYCGSTNVKKIGLLNRAVSTELWGLGSKKIGKQFHCNNCGADF